MPQLQRKYNVPAIPQRIRYGSCFLSYIQNRKRTSKLWHMFRLSPSVTQIKTDLFVYSAKVKRDRFQKQLSKLNS